MSRKTCIITGANAGIGFAAAKQLAGAGWHVVLSCRNESRGAQAIDTIKQAQPDASVELGLVDMGLQESVSTFAASQQHRPLDGLIHNAADFDIRRKERVMTAEGIEQVWATNVVGPVLLTELLMPQLAQAETGRVLGVTSKGLMLYPRLEVDLEDPEFAERRFTVQKAYYQSKLAHLMTMMAFAKQHADTSTTFNAMRVTNVKIDISRYPGLSKFLLAIYRIKSAFSISPDDMARAYVRAVSEPEFSSLNGAHLDERCKVVSSNRFSRDPGNVVRVAETVRSYLKQPA